jgi:hypothetical protein
MTAHHLSTRYRRLLRVYPPGPRRDELLGTLVEAAPEGRTRPTLRETVNLLRHGMRARLGRPASRGVVAVAVLTSLVAGYLAAAVAYRIALEDAPALPHGAELAEIQGALFPGLTSWSEQDGQVFSDLNSPTVTDLLLGGHDEEFFYATVTIGPGDRFIPGDYRAWTEQAAGRLAAQGWDVGEAAPTGTTENESGDLMQDGTYLVARRGDLTMELNAGAWGIDVPAGQFEVDATIRRFPPRSAAVIAVAAGLPAALLGWLLLGWGSRRTENAGVRVRFLTREPVVVAMAVLAPLWFSGASGFVAETLRHGVVYQPFWWMATGWAAGYALFAGALCLLALIVAAVAGRRQPAVREPA